jgi:nicastrin
MRRSCTTRTRRAAASRALWVAAACAVLVARVVATSEFYERIYFTLRDAHPCVRLLNVNGTVGCSTPARGLEGVLRAVPDFLALTTLVANPPSERLAVVMPVSLLTKANIDQLRGAVRLAGIIVTPQPRPAFGSPASKERDEGGYDWNPGGDALLLADYPFAVVLATEAEAAEASARAARNAEWRAEGDFERHHADFQYEMWAEGSTGACLASASCLPVGGYSVWGMAGPLLANDSRPVVWAFARSDSTALFHEVAAGVDTAVSGMVALLEAVSILAPHSAALQALPRRVAWALFGAESFNFVGSRKFVEDVQSFQCATPSSDGTGCQSPFKSDLSFLALRNVSVASVIELGQVGLTDNLFLHRQRDGNAATTALAATVQGLAPGVGITLSAANASTPGVPPSSLRAFLARNASVPGVVLTDHAGPYANAFYQSHLDTVEQLGDGAVTKLMNVALLTARSLYQAAGGADAGVLNAMAANHSRVLLLYTCMAQGDLCGRLLSTVDMAPDSVDFSTYYPGVYRIRAFSGVSGLPRFLFERLAALRASTNFSTFFHDAVDPDLVFDQRSRLWSVRANSSSPVWTESNWPPLIETRLYQRESPTTEYAMLGVGLALTVLAVPALHLLLRYLDANFKMV